jgi:hypothetical protein
MLIPENQSIVQYTLIYFTPSFCTEQLMQLLYGSLPKQIN